MKVELRLATAALLGLVAAAPSGCVRARREVMLIVSTNIPCGTVDRIKILLYRGSSPVATYDQNFARADCSPTVTDSIPRSPLAINMPFRLGIVDSRRSDDRLRVEVQGLGVMGVAVTAQAETDFVDDKVYAVPVELTYQCIGFMTCPPGTACRIRPGGGTPACGSIYREPGTLGTFPQALTIHETIDSDGRDQ